jgi:selenocysteine lyase/cysteine desulfurase
MERSMNPDRRSLLQSLAGGAVVAPLLRSTVHSEPVAAAPRGASDPMSLSTDETFWATVRAAYSIDTKIINLNNAGVSPQPTVVQEAVIANYRFANLVPDWNMWEKLDAGRPVIKESLARLADCGAEEIALNRNATEGLCTVIFGMHLNRGDEVVLSDWDYDALRHAWEQRSRRDGIVLKFAQFDPMDAEASVIEAYTKVIGPRTRVVYSTHVLHYTGRVMPIAAITALARAQGALSVVDAAQSFAQMPVSFKDFGCDFMAVSLHKWLCAPFGTGMLVARRDRIDDIWPLIAAYDDEPPGIGKLDGWSLGTYSSASEQGIKQAIEFHNTLGAERIHARLRYLTRYWAGQAADIPGFKLHTPIEADSQGAVALFSLAGHDASEVEKRLMGEWHVHTRMRKRKDLYGIRVSPHIYTSKQDLDRLVKGLRAIAS